MNLFDKIAFGLILFLLVVSFFASGLLVLGGSTLALIPFVGAGCATGYLILGPTFDKI